MYGIMLIVVLVLTGGVIAFIGDRLGTKVGKKKLSLFGMRPKHTSILVTIITGILITTVTFGILSIASKDVRTALFGMDKLKAELADKQKSLELTSTSLESIKNDLNSTKEEYAKSKKDLQATKQDLTEAEEAAKQLKLEQITLKNNNQKLWSDNQILAQNNQSLLDSNNSLRVDNANLEKTNNDLKEGIETIRERPIVYRVGELLASGIIKKTNNQQEIQEDLSQIMALANSKVIDKIGKEGSRDGVWIYPLEYQEAIEKLKHAQGDTVIRLIVAANLVKGDPVLTNLEMHPNRTVYQANELVFQKDYAVAPDGSNTEMLINDFLRNVNATAVSNGILPNPLTGTVGVINGNQIYAIEKALSNNKGSNILISAFAVNNTEVLGPLRLNIYLKHETEQDINHE